MEKAIDLFCISSEEELEKVTKIIGFTIQYRKKNPHC